MSDAVCCDQCKTFAETEGYPFRPGRHRLTLPAGWMRVFAEMGAAGVGDRESVPPLGEFCSYKCAALYLSLKDAA